MKIRCGIGIGWSGLLLVVIIGGKIVVNKLWYEIVFF